jgi:hypothetical protein
MVGWRRRDGEPMSQRLERARQHLRAGRPRDAVHALSIRGQPADQSDLFQDVHAYATQRLAEHKDRARKTNTVPSLDAAAVQRVLRWLTREELDAGRQALAEGRVVAAANALEAAAHIDDRGALASQLHAKALLEYVRKDMGQQEPSPLDRTRDLLDKAAHLARRAARDPVLRDTADALMAEIDPLLADVNGRLAQEAARRAREAGHKEIDDLVRRWNAMIEHYGGRTFIYDVEVANLRSSLATLQTDVNTQSRRHPPDSPEGRHLADLKLQIAELLARFR